MLGRLIPEYFPKIFGPTKDQPLQKELSCNKMQELCELINRDYTVKKSMAEIAYGFVKVANESMCRPIRSITQGKGIDPRTHILAVFGSAGGQHACALAKNLGIKKIFIHEYVGILSAYGLARSSVVEDQ